MPHSLISLRATSDMREPTFVPLLEAHRSGQGENRFAGALGRTRTDGLGSDHDLRAIAFKSRQRPARSESASSRRTATDRSIFRRTRRLAGSAGPVGFSFYHSESSAARPVRRPGPPPGSRGGETRVRVTDRQAVTLASGPAPSRPGHACCGCANLLFILMKRFY